MIEVFELKSFCDGHSIVCDHMPSMDEATKMLEVNGTRRREYAKPSMSCNLCLQGSDEGRQSALMRLRLP